MLITILFQNLCWDKAMKHVLRFANCPYFCFFKHINDEALNACVHALIVTIDELRVLYLDDIDELGAISPDSYHDCIDQSGKYTKICINCFTLFNNNYNTLGCLQHKHNRIFFNEGNLCDTSEIKTALRWAYLFSKNKLHHRLSTLPR